MELRVYADGSATIASKPGGYGYVVVIDNKKVLEGNGHIPKATNNDAEMMAAIQGLAAALKYVNEQKSINIDNTYEVILCSDSQITLGWADGTYRFKQESKYDKYKTLKELMLRLKAKTKWIRGHSGEEFNERCDELANLGRLNLGPNDEIPTKTFKPSIKKSKIQKRENSIICIKINNKTKILDFHKNIIEDYNEEIHGKRNIYNIEGT